MVLFGYGPRACGARLRFDVALRQRHVAGGREHLDPILRIYRSLRQLGARERPNRRKRGGMLRYAGP